MRRTAVVAVLVGVIGLVAACGEDTAGTPKGSPKKSSSPPSTSRAPFDGEVLADGEVVKVEKVDGVDLKSPDDGQLHNYGVGMEVLDFGTADVVDAGEGLEYGAKEDSSLLAFRLRVVPFADSLGDKVSATVSVDGVQRELPDFEYALGGGTSQGDTTLQYVVAVPKDRREVELELKYANLPQTYDLLEGKRTGEEPEVLYRSEDSPSVYVESLTPGTVQVTDADGEAGSYTVTVNRAELTYFASELGELPSGPDKAWLVLAHETRGDGSLDSSFYECGIPSTAYTLTDDSGTAYQAAGKYFTGGTMGGDQTVVFEVPADLTTAELTVAPQSFSCNGGIDVTFTATAPGKVSISLPEK
jgi:hypothetical protein